MAQSIRSNLIERLVELAVLLTEAMDRELAVQGLTRARAEVVWRLHQQSPMTQRELSDALRCTPRNVTALVDALEAAGFVTRSPHPTDRRATLVTLTERGRAVAAEWRTEYQKLATLLVEGIPARKLSAFADTLDQLLERLRQAASSSFTQEIRLQSQR